MKIFNSIDTGISVLGVALSVEDLSNILNLVLLIVCCLNLVIKFSISLYNGIKNKNLNDINVLIQEAQEELNKLKGGNKNE